MPGRSASRTGRFGSSFGRSGRGSGSLRSPRVPPEFLPHLLQGSPQLLDLHLQVAELARGPRPARDARRGRGRRPQARHSRPAGAARPAGGRRGRGPRAAGPAGPRPGPGLPRPPASARPPRGPLSGPLDRLPGLLDRLPVTPLRAGPSSRSPTRSRPRSSRGGSFRSSPRRSFRSTSRFSSRSRSRSWATAGPKASPSPPRPRTAASPNRVSPAGHVAHDHGYSPLKVSDRPGPARERAGIGPDPPRNAAVSTRAVA